MFEKLLALLPYSPGLGHQMAFYSRRMREEAAIRRTGMIFIVLAFMIQFFTVLSPPQPTVAGSSNDLINGGISSAAEAKKRCLGNIDGENYGSIMHYFGITCEAIGNASTTNITVNGQDYYSMGRNPQGATNNATGKATNETPYNVPGAGKLYMRKLASWYSNPSKQEKVLRVKNQDGKTFYILYGCANLVSVGLPTPSPFTPSTPEKPAPVATPAPPKGTAAPAPTPPAPTPPAPAPPAPTPPAPTPGKPCEKSLSSTDTVACIVVSKAAANVTAGVADANNTTAKAGDVITYTLYAQNDGKADVKDFVFEENLNDVLDYADLTDLHGGNLRAADKTVTWAAETIKAGAKASHQITVKVKDPIPQTPTAPSDSSHFDLIMTNVYGNAVNIKLPGTPAKAVEVATTQQLPNTGPGTSLLIAAAVVIVSGYFYSRAQLLARESNLALKESTT